MAGREGDRGTNFSNIPWNADGPIEEGATHKSKKKNLVCVQSASPTRRPWW